MSTHTAVETLLVRVRDWWRTQNELSRLNPEELGQGRCGLGYEHGALKDLVARGPDAANLLYERMQALAYRRRMSISAANGLHARSPKDVRVLQ